MSSLLLSFGPAWVQLGLVLAHFLWQGTAIALLLAGALFLLRRRSPDTRYAACGLAMLLMAASPIATACYVRSHPFPALLAGELPLSPRPAPAMSRSDEPSSVIHETRETMAPVEAPVAISTSVKHDGSATSRRGAVTERALPSPARIEGTTVNHTAGIPVASVDRGSRSRWYGLSLQSAAIVWTVGVLAMSVRLLAGWLGLRRLYLGRSEPLPDTVENVVRRMRRRLGLGERTEVLATQAWREPVAFGLLKPVVLLPLSMLTQCPTEVVEAMIAHELAHVRRYDLWVNVFQRVIEAVLFYHPAVWWASGRMRLERELCCDDLAIRVTGRRAEYATALVELCRTWQGSMTPALAAGMFGPRLTMMTRIRRVLRMPATRDESSRSGFLLAGPLSVVLAGTFVLVASLKASEPSDASAASPPAPTTTVVAVSATPTTSAPARTLRAAATTRPAPVGAWPSVKPAASRPAHPSDLRTYEFAWENMSVLEALEDFRGQVGLSMPNLNRVVSESGREGETISFSSLRPMSFDDALLTVNHLIENWDMWIVRQDQYLDIRTLSDWQKHIPVKNRFGSEAALREARLPQWDVASVMYTLGLQSSESLIELAANAVPEGTAVAKMYPETGRIEAAGIVQYVEQILEVIKQYEGEAGASEVPTHQVASPTIISRPASDAIARNGPTAPRHSTAHGSSGAETVAEASAEPMSVTAIAPRHTSEPGVGRSWLAIRSQADGVVAEILVKDGQKIRAGDLVARLDSEEIKLEVEAAQVRRGDAVRSIAGFDALRPESRSADVKNEYEKAKSSLQLAEIELKRCMLRLQRTEIRSPWDGEISGDRHTTTAGAGALLALVGKRVVAGDPIVEVLVTATRDGGTGRDAQTQPAATPSSRRRGPSVEPAATPGGRTAQPVPTAEPAGRR